MAFLMALTHSFNSCYVPSKRQLQRPCSPSYHSSYPSTGLASTSPLPSHRECADDLGGHDHLFLWVPAGRRGVNPTATSFNPSWLLCTGYIALDSHATPTKLFITIKPSKTDPFRERGYHHPRKDRSPALPHDVHPAVHCKARSTSWPPLLFQGGLFPHSREICEGG